MVGSKEIRVESYMGKVGMTKGKHGNHTASGVEGHHLPPIDPVTGERLPGGNGCSYYSNCFTCPFEPDDCKYEEDRLRMIRNRQGKEV